MFGNSRLKAGLKTLNNLVYRVINLNKDEHGCLKLLSVFIFIFLWLLFPLFFHFLVSTGL